MVQWLDKVVAKCPWLAKAMDIWHQGPPPPTHTRQTVPLYNNRNFIVHFMIIQGVDFLDLENREVCFAFLQFHEG